MTTKVAITIDTELIAQVDSLIFQKVFPNRSKAVQSSIESQLIQLQRDRRRTTTQQRITPHDRSTTAIQQRPIACSTCLHKILKY